MAEPGNRDFTREPKFQSGCMHCGETNVYRMKLLDELNRPREVCMECFAKKVHEFLKDKFVLAPVLAPKPVAVPTPVVAETKIQDVVLPAPTTTISSGMVKGTKDGMTVGM